LISVLNSVNNILGANAKPQMNAKSVDRFLNQRMTVRILLLPQHSRLWIEQKSMAEHWQQMGGAIATRNDELKMYTWDNEHIAHIEAALRTAQRAMRLITAGGLVCSTEPLFSSPRDKADAITVLIKPDRVA
jgi:hypothetical protein